MSCSACGCSFDSREEQTEHYKLDWHRFNLRQRLVGAQSVSAESFEKIAGEISSISGSDSEESDSYTEPEGPRCHDVWDVSGPGSRECPGDERPQRRRSTRVLFRSAEGEYLSVYRCVLQGKQVSREDEDKDILASLLSLNPETIWVILMTGGGHFAGAVFRGGVAVHHKTFHRYTVRAKRGVAQGARDGQNRSHAPKSAGASLRRYNEAALVKDIEDLLLSWSEFLQAASAIFFRASSYNKGIFFSGKVLALNRSDGRLRPIPFLTRRATFKEVKRVHAALSTVEIYAKDTDISTIHSPQRKVWKKPLKSAEDALGSDRDERQDVTLNPSDLPSTLETVEETLGTLDLREFEVSPKKKRGKRKKKFAAGKTMQQEAPDSPEGEDPERMQTMDTGCADPGTGPLSTGEPDQGMKQRRIIRAIPTGTAEEGSEGYRVRNELYTACKTGDRERLQELLHDLLPAPVLDPGSGRVQSPRPAADTTHAPDQRPDGHRQNPEQQAPDSSRGPEQQTAERETADDSRGPEQQMAEWETADHSQRLEQETAERETADDSRGPEQETAERETADDSRGPEQQTADGDGTGPRGGAAGAGGPRGRGVVTAAMLSEAVDESGFTLLHVAAAAAQRSVLHLLLAAGSDPALRDKRGQPAYAVSADRDTRNEFRRYMAEHPEQYNYTKAQISAPLTCEAESQKAEKKRAQKVARRLREKERKEEKRRLEEEEMEKRRYAALSEREKRALAAEKRFAQQLAGTGASPIIRRCWLCGQSLAGRVPFEYLDYSFCTTRCLQDHKRQQRI